MSIKSNGHVLVEVLLAIAIFAVIASAVLGGFVSSRDGKVTQKQALLAKGYLDQAVEAVRSVRERSWDLVSVNGIYHPYLNGSIWELGDESEEIDGFTRQIEIKDILRDVSVPSGDVVPLGGNMDPASKTIVVTVSWGPLERQQISSTLLLTRYEQNTIDEQTTEGDFEDGDFLGTTIQNDNGGEVILGAGGFGNWCKPNNFIRAQLDLPQSGAARDIKAIEGKAFTGTNQSGTGSFVEININDENPPVPSISSTISGYETNDVFIDNGYAYVASEDVSRDVIIIDLSTNQEVGYFNDSAWFGTAQGVFVVGNVGYATIGFRLHTFDLSSKTGNRPELDSVFLWATAYRFHVVGSYAYVALDYGSAELRLVNVSNPRDIRLAAKANVNGERGQEVFVNETGTRAYLATDESSSLHELFIINTNVSASNKNSSSYNLPIISSYNSNGMDPRGVTVVTNNKALLVGVGGEEYQVIDLSTESSPTRCGGADINTSVYGVSAVLETDGDAYSYIVTGDADSEFKIIEGGPGGGYATEGTFESETFDAGAGKTHMFNRVIADTTIPDDTDLYFQVATFGDGTQECDDITPSYFGPDGTSSTFYDHDGFIPYANLPSPDSNPARCFRYKLFLETDDTSKTPLFNSMKVNYSP